MSCSVAVNCTGFPNHCPLSAPDADVAGIGVVWGFGLTSFITVALSAPIAMLSLIDFVVIRSPRFRWLAKNLHLSTEQQHEGWIDNLVHIIIGLSDQHLVTGLAILVVGFSKHCSMSSRHFWVIFDLGWFSSVTHLASLPVLNYYLRDYPRWRDLRVALMLSNFGFLIAAAILTFGNYDPASHDCPIQCSFDRFQTSDFPLSKIHITQMVFITLGFFWALIHLYAPDEIWRMRHAMIVDQGFGTDLPYLRHYIETRQSRLSMVNAHTTAKDIINDAVHFRHARSGFINFISKYHRKYEDSTGYLIFRWILLLLYAPPSAIVWLNLVSMWSMGAARLVQDRQWSVAAEDEWGFGQVLPLLLLVLPFFTVTEVAQEFRRKRKSEGRDADKITTTGDPDAHSDTTLLITKDPGETTSHVDLENVPLDHVSPAKLAHHSTQPNPSSMSHSSYQLPKRSSTSSSLFAAKEFPPTKSQFSPPIKSPGSPFSPMHMPPNATGYNSLPDEEPDHELPVTDLEAHWNTVDISRMDTSREGNLDSQEDPESLMYPKGKEATARQAPSPTPALL